MQSLIYFLIWGVVIFLVMRLGCGAHIMGHGHGQQDSPDNAVKSPEKAIDPVCGMIVETAKARSTVYSGWAYYFCSEDCRQKFETAPQTYLAEGAAKEHHYEH